MENFNDLLEIFKRKKSSFNENYLGENMILDRVIVMDNVSGLADRSEKFANFLSVSRNIFNTIYLIRQHWQMILSQTKIFDFFQDRSSCSYN